MANYEIVWNPYGEKSYPVERKGLLLQSAWIDSYREVIEELGITAIFLNSAKGWTNFDCSFLSSLPMIEEVQIVAPSVTGLESLAKMPHLTDLKVTASSDSQVRFDQLSSLRKVYLYWWAGASSIFECQSLREIHLDLITELPPHWASCWTSLEAFTLSNSEISHIDVSSLRKLTKLEFNNLPKLKDFSSISCLGQLSWLSISGCKQISSIDFISSLTNLEVLLLTDNKEINTLAPIEYLHKLRALSFVGSTVIKDGQLSKHF